LEGEREVAKRKFHEHHQQIKSWFDRSQVGNKYLQVGDLVLIWNTNHEEKGKHAKLQQLWLGPFQIVEKIG